MAAHRSANVRLAEQEETLKKLRIKAAKESAQNSPELAPLVAQLSTLKSERTKFKNVLADGDNAGPMSTKVRMEKAERRIQEIGEADMDARVKLPEIEGQIEAIEREIASKVNELTANVN